MSVLTPRQQEIISNISPGADQVNLGALMEQALSGVLPPGSVSLAEIENGTDGQVIVGQTGSALLFKSLTGDITLSNAGVTAVAAIDLETATVTNIASAEVMIGTAAGTAGFYGFTGDITLSNAGVTAVAALDLETATVTGIADTEIMIGDGAASATFKSLSGDVTLANDGAVTIGDIDHDVTIYSADAGAAGRSLIFQHESASPAASDVIGATVYRGEDDGGTATDYVSVYGGIVDPAAGSEAGAWGVQLTAGGTLPTVSNMQLIVSGLALDRTDDGATGMALTLNQTSASPAADDVVGLLKFTGKDAGGNATEYGQINTTIVSTVENEESAKVLIQAANIDGGAITTVAGFSVSGSTLASDLDMIGRLDVEDTGDGGASNGNIIKKTNQAGEAYTGTTAGLMVKMYDADGTATVPSGEFCAGYFNLKGLHTDPGNNTSIISAHVHGSNTTTVHAGLWLYGDMTNGVKASGSTLTSMIDVAEATAITNVINATTNTASLLEVAAAGTDKIVEANTGTPAGAVAHIVRITVAGTPYYIPAYAGKPS